MGARLHETFERPELPLPSDRSTGLVFTVIALVVAYFWRSHVTVSAVAAGFAIVLAAISLLRPSLLRPLNVLWMRFATVVGKIMNPIVMLVLFAIAIVPAGLIMQLMRDPLRRRRGDGTTHWIATNAAERASLSNMKNQF